MSEALNDLAGFGSSVGTGFNPENIDTLMSTIKTKYDELGDSLIDNWPNVTSTMQANWIGYDEQDAEQVIADRVIELYNSCQGLVQEAIDNIKAAGEAWVEFTNSNILRVEGGDGGPIRQALSYEFQTVTVEPNENIKSVVTVSPVEFGANTTYGVVSNGNDTIKGALNTFTENVTESVESIKNSIDSGSAFVGDSQSSSINEYLSKVMEKVGQLTVDIEEIENKIDQLTTSGYGEASEQVGQAFNVE